MIAGIAREVIRRIREAGQQTTSGTLEKLITIETLDRYSGATEIMAADGAVITPAAREEASRRGITIACGRTLPTVGMETALPEKSQNSDVLCQQLARRGISLPDGIEMVWTDGPAGEVYRRCGKGQRAAMITELSDVDRFANELAPNAWVLDRKKLSLVAAVNVAARIARISKPVNGVEK
jgi:cell division protein ZapA (FtsZ GTPase activity inhibitor)